MLEIGVENSFSMQLWLEYFPHAHIYGIDINVEETGLRLTIFKADQSDIYQLQSVKQRIQYPIFFIIDDGSHIPEHQILTFDYFFKDLLLPGGTYIIEDIETSYWSRGGLYGYSTRYGYHHSKSAIEIFKDLVDDVNSEFLTESAKTDQTRALNRCFSTETRSWVNSITFGMNCIIIVKKTELEFKTYTHRVYRFKNNL